MRAVEYAYHHSQPDDVLRKAITNFVIKSVHMRESRDGKHLSHADNFYEIIREMPDINDGLLKRLIDHR